MKLLALVLVIFLVSGCPTDFTLHVDWDAGTVSVKPVGGAGGVGGVAGSPAGTGGSVGSVSGIGGVSGSASGAGGSSGAVGASGTGGSAGTKFAVGVGEWYLAPSWGFGSPWASTSPDFGHWNTVNLWSPAFLADLKPMKVLRLMDWNGTNYSKVQHWSERRLPTDPGNYEIYVDGQTGLVPGLAYELQFDLAKRSGIETLWINLPMLADDDYITQFAALAQRSLPPGTRLVVEWSNEPDGGWFGQTAQSQTQAASLGLPGSNQFYQGAAFTTLRTVKLAAAMHAVLGSRVSVVRCGVGNTDLLRQSLANVYQSSQWNPTHEVIDALCMSFYFGNGRDGQSYALSQVKSDIDQLVTGEDGATTFEAMRDRFGIKGLFVYEGGPHVLQNSGTFSGSAVIGPAMTYLLDSAAPHFQLFALYTATSSWPNASGQGAWGLKKLYGGPETTKSQAVLDWIAAH